MSLDVLELLKVVTPTALTVAGTMVGWYFARGVGDREAQRNETEVQDILAARAADRQASNAKIVESIARWTVTDNPKDSPKHGPKESPDDDSTRDIVAPQPEPESGPQAPAAGRLVRLLDAFERRSDERFAIQRAHYNNALRQSSIYFAFSVIVGGVGFALLITGAGLALAEVVEVGTLTALGGVLAEGAAALIFNQSGKAKADAQKNLTAIEDAEERDENRQMALIYAWQIEDPVLRDSTNAEMAQKYLSLLERTHERDKPPTKA